jgi:hypothetical protein
MLNLPQSVHWYWQYPSVRSKETCSIYLSQSIDTDNIPQRSKEKCSIYLSQSIDTDNIPQWDQRKNVQFTSVCPLILTISLSEIKGKMFNLPQSVHWYWDIVSINGLTEVNLTIFLWSLRDIISINGLTEVNWTFFLWSLWGILSVSMDWLR